MNPEIFGVDLGGVILAKDSTGVTAFSSDNYLQRAAVSGALEAIRLLSEKRFGDKMFIVSKCSEENAVKNLNWLFHHHFFELTGMRCEHVFFCRERADKAPICERLGVTHFVDDRLDVMRHLITVENLYLFQPDPAELQQFAQFLSRVKQVNTWQEILNDLLD